MSRPGDLPPDPHALAVAYYYGRKPLNPGALIGDRVICAWPRSRGDFSHAELVFGYDPKTFYQRCASSSMRDGGVRTRPINLASGRWRVKPIVGATVQRQKAALDWYRTHDRMPFDYLGIAGFVLPGRLQNPRAAFCSESVALAMGLAETRISPSRMEREHDMLFNFGATS